jgi:hypothetical protein
MRGVGLRVTWRRNLLEIERIFLSPMPSNRMAALHVTHSVPKKLERISTVSQAEQGLDMWRISLMSMVLSSQMDRKIACKQLRSLSQYEKRKLSHLLVVLVNDAWVWCDKPWLR